MNKAIALYVHVPFCRNICFYCDFCKVFYQEDAANRYLDTLERELEGKNYWFKSIYLGGGSPSSLKAYQLERLLRMLSKYKSESSSFCIELNPEDMDDEKLSLLKQYGINRVSIGIQTFDDKFLEKLNRRHNKQMVFKLIEDLRNLGIFDINGDLMYALPNQKRTQLLADLKIMVENLKLPHISTYALSIEKNTYFAVKKVSALSDDEAAEQYALIGKYLRKANYEHYEVSNFAKKGYESKHNLVYWHAEEYVGLGPGASGYEKGVRYQVSSSVSAYCAGKITKSHEEISLDEQAYERIILSLRLKEGLDIEKYNQDFQRDFLKDYEKVLAKLLKDQLVVIKGKHLIVKEDKLFILNRILREF